MSLFGGLPQDLFSKGDSSQTPYTYSTSSYSTKRISTGVWPLLSPSLLIGPQPYEVDLAKGGPTELLKSCTVDMDSALCPPLKRFSLNVAPLAIQGMDNSRSDPNALLLDLDTQDLYTDNGPKLGALGTPWAVPTKNTSPSTPCNEAYEDTDGVYTSPVPIRGAPLKFQKVYFAGEDLGAETRNNGYYAYFLCSSPILNSADCEGSTSSFSPRNANWNYMEGVDAEWSGINMGGGCSNAIAEIATTGYILDGSPYTQYYTEKDIVWGDADGSNHDGKGQIMTLSGGCSDMLIFSGACNAVSAVRQIKFSDSADDAVTGKYATVVQLFADFVATGVGLCLGDDEGTIVSGNILFQPCGPAAHLPDCIY